MNKRRLCFALVISIFLVLTSCAFAKESGTVFFVDAPKIDGEWTRMLMKQDISTMEVEAICLADFYLIDGFAQTTGVFAAREKSENEKTEVLYIREDGEIQLMYEISDPMLLQVFAMHGDNVYYVRQTQNKEYCCEFVRMSINGDAFVYPYSAYQECYCPASEDDFWAGWYDTSDSDPIKWEDKTYETQSVTFSKNGYMAYEAFRDGYYNQKGALLDRYIDIMDPEGNIICIGKGECPVWMNEDTLLYLSNDNFVYEYSLQEGIAKPHLTQKGKKIEIFPMSYESYISVSKDGKTFVCMLALDLGGSKAMVFNLETGKKYRLKNMNPATIADREKVYFGT